MCEPFLIWTHYHPELLSISLLTRVLGTKTLAPDSLQLPTTEPFSVEQLVSMDQIFSPKIHIVKS
jgi:hypothetical protein